MAASSGDNSMVPKPSHHAWRWGGRVRRLPWEPGAGEFADGVEHRWQLKGPKQVAQLSDRKATGWQGAAGVETGIGLKGEVGLRSACRISTQIRCEVTHPSRGLSTRPQLCVLLCKRNPAYFQVLTEEVDTFAD